VNHKGSTGDSFQYGNKYAGARVLSVQKPEQVFPVPGPTSARFTLVASATGKLRCRSGIFLGSQTTQ